MIEKFDERHLTQEINTISRKEILELLTQFINGEINRDFIEKWADEITVGEKFQIAAQEHDFLAEIIFSLDQINDYEDNLVEESIPYYIECLKRIREPNIGLMFLEVIHKRNHIINAIKKYTRNIIQKKTFITWIKSLELPNPVELWILSTHPQKKELTIFANSFSKVDDAVQLICDLIKGG